MWHTREGIRTVHGADSYFLLGLLLLIIIIDSACPIAPPRAAGDGPSPTGLRAVLARREGEVSLLQEDSRAKEEELLRALAQIQVCGWGGRVGVGGWGWGWGHAHTRAHLLTRTRVHTHAHTHKPFPPPTHLQASHTQCEELRRQADNLGKQLRLTAEALEAKDVELEELRWAGADFNNLG